MINLLKGIHVSGKGPVVVLLHSSLSSSKQWTILVNHLKSEFTVINIDILGYGSARNVECPENYRASVEVNRIKSTLNQLGLENEPYHIVGHSFGGALGLKLAVEEPKRVLSLSLYEPVPFHLIEENTEEKLILNELFKKVNVDDLFMAAEAFMDYWNIEGFFKSLPLRVQQSASNEMKKVNIDSIALMSETYGPNEINKIASPVLMITGERSPELSKVLANIIVSSLVNVRQDIFDAGHMGVISHAHIIQPKIAEFIQNAN